jgi:hypothetical protein
MKRILQNLLLIIIFYQLKIDFNLYAVNSCLDFSNSLLTAVDRIENELRANKVKELMNKDVVQDYLALHSKELKLPKDANRDYMKFWKELVKQGYDPNRVITFSVESSFLKPMNDEIFLGKTMPNAFGASSYNKLYEEIQSNPLLASRIVQSRMVGEYKDFKRLEQTFILKDGDNRERFEEMIQTAFRRAVEKFSKEVKALRIEELYATRTDGAAHPELWFQGGIGSNPLEVNAAARLSRDLPKQGTVSLTRFSDHVDRLYSEVKSINEIQKEVALSKEFLEFGITNKMENGKVILSKDMIAVIRGIKANDYKTAEAYFNAIENRVKLIFNHDISLSDVALLVKYQKSVDRISPPLFQRERVEIDLGNTEHGIVSVDFTGIGVDNLRAQMEALANASIEGIDKVATLNRIYGKLEAGIQTVTDQMSLAKRKFSEIVKEIAGSESKVQFSGDDGIYLPIFSKWTKSQKDLLVKRLAETTDPSKYRVTFVHSTYTNGEIIPLEKRSAQIVRAESLEKEIRKALVSYQNFNLAEAKKIITAIDFSPHFNEGGIFKVMVSGKKFSDNEKKIMENAVKSTIKSANSETLLSIEYIE